jgi:hypothetical protein
VAEWQKRLEDNFSVDGIIGGHLSEIFALEETCGQFFLDTFHGQSVAIDSFQSFFIETVKKTLRWVSENDWPKDSPNYPMILLYYVVMFRSFRACENLLLKGYPLDGYALLRDLKDRAIFLGAIVHNITTFQSLHGWGGTKEITWEEYKKIKNQRQKEELRVLGRMIRKDSGMPHGIIKELEIWEQLFNEEMHGSKFSFYNELADWIDGKSTLSIGPTPKKLSMTMYMNRVTEIAWLTVRLLPYLQPVRNAFGEEWGERQKILDESLRYMEESLGQLGKKIGEAFIYFVDQKFSFSEPFFYQEATGNS